MKILSKLKLSREAYLFDSNLYLLKIFLSIMTAYVICSNLPIVQNDMISVLFGLMLTLEPVNIAGVKSGKGQIEASIIGGIITAIIVSVGGINFVTVPLSIGLTVYVCLLMDWNNVSPVAFFTAIYMTQLAQIGADGQISMMLTLRLRLFALISGVIIALLYNFIFSKIFYKSMIEKRSVYLLESLSKIVNEISGNISDNLKEPMAYTEYLYKMISIKEKIPALFYDIDMLQNHLGDMEANNKEVKKFSEITVDIRDINHFLLDLVIDKIENMEAKSSNVFKNEEVDIVINKEILELDKIINEISLWIEKDIKASKNEYEFTQFNSIKIKEKLDDIAELIES